MADMSIMLLVVGVVAAVLLVVWLATPSGDDKGDKGDKDAKGIPPTQYTLTINTVGNGATTGAGTYDKGTRVDVTATPAPGWKFLNWTDENLYRGSGYVNSSNGITTMNTDKTITANFYCQFREYHEQSNKNQQRTKFIS